MLHYRFSEVRCKLHQTHNEWNVDEMVRKKWEKIIKRKASLKTFGFAAFMPLPGIVSGFLTWRDPRLSIFLSMFATG